MAAIRRLGIVGDSASAGWIWGHDTASGGPGAWWELLAERLANIPGVGPRIGSGFRAVSLNSFFQPAFNATVEWSFAGSWSGGPVTPSTADKGLYGYTYSTSSGALNTAGYAVPTQWRPAVAVTLYYAATAAMGDWGVKFNNAGSTFHMNADFGLPISHDLAIHSVTLKASAFSLSKFTAITISGPTSGTVMPVGLELWYVDPSSNPDGLIVDNYSQSGRQLDELVLTTSGADHMALFDSVVRETATGIYACATPSNRPTVGVLMEHGNDDKNNNVTQFATDLTTFYNRIHPLCTQAWWNLWELIPPRGDGSGIDITWQANYRAQLKTTAASLGVPVFDIFDQWSQRGWTNNLQTFQGGVLDIDSNHENAYGHQLIAEALYPFVRRVFFPYVDASRPNLLAPQGKTVGGNEVGGVWADPNVVAGFANGALKILPETTYT